MREEGEHGVTSVARDSDKSEREKQQSLPTLLHYWNCAQRAITPTHTFTPTHIHTHTHTYTPTYTSTHTPTHTSTQHLIPEVLVPLFTTTATLMTTCPLDSCELLTYRGGRGRLTTTRATFSVASKVGQAAWKTIEYLTQQQPALQLLSKRTLGGGIMEVALLRDFFFFLLTAKAIPYVPVLLLRSLPLSIFSFLF